MENKTQPLVSIGVPVFNGGGKLTCALDSLLEQDYSNIEVIISDNASTDYTPEICEKYFRKDSRVKYSRSEQNLGGIWNFNRVFELSSGKYFMWTAHDDIRDPSYISKCVEVLEADPNAVLCHSYTKMKIEGNTNILCIATLNTVDGIEDIVERYLMVLKTFPAVAMYGLMRADAVKTTLLLEKHIASDLAFIQELSLHGKFRQVHEVLFTYFGREQWNTIEQDYQHIFHGEKKPKFYLPFFVLAKNHIRRILRAPLKKKIKIHLSGVIIIYNMKVIFSKLFVRFITLINKDTCPEKIRKYIEKSFLENMNIKPIDRDLFEARVRKVQLKNWTGK